MEAWPSTLPQRVMVDYEIDFRTGLCDEGETRNPQRLRTHSEREATFQIFVTAAELETFKTFWNTTLNQSAPFTAPWLESMGYEYHFLRFLEAPGWTHSGGNYWVVSLPVEIIANVETDSEGDPAIWIPEEEEE